MPYPKVPDLGRLVHDIGVYTQLQHEYGAKGLEPILAGAEKALRTALRNVKARPIDKALAAKEPNSLNAIQAQRPNGPRKLWAQMDAAAYAERLPGAFLGRMAGCTLGAPVEFWLVENMEKWAKEIGDPFPPRDYWSRITNPHHLRYSVSRCDAYTRSKLHGVPVDDDITYTLLGLLIVEDFGPNFTVENVGEAWLRHLPYACTAEDVALKNLKKGVPALKAGATDNPFCEWIGADIRADPWGYMAPGWPEKAAAMAYHDAYISHRRQGVYGEMFFAAAIAAGFAVSDPLEALRIGLTEIPKECALAKAVKWALSAAPKIRNYKQARAAMEKKFAGMHRVHTINNACLTIWGLTIGRKDFTRVIGETVAMGMDTDCTAATAGSICGATIGRKGIPKHWYRNFNNTVHSYLIGNTKFRIDDLLARYAAQARR
ncbi:MAG: ADP-ribosylglycohydrolase family protein, partial [Planctomycetota bacterium]|nr:ADP-ribosylglycohydrolase family protein [Planctomycetota bacterium]